MAKHFNPAVVGSIAVASPALLIKSEEPTLFMKRRLARSQRRSRRAL